MAPEVLAAIISSGAAVTAAGASGVAQGKLNKKTMQFNREEAEKQRNWSEQMALQQNQWNLDLWNKENEYNTPSAQMERLRDAGLNPLYYGLDGNSASGAFEAAQPLGYERASIGNLVNPVQSGLSAAAQVASIGNIQADTAKKNNENQSETVRREKLQTDILLEKQELQNKLAEEGLTDAQRMSIEKSLEWIDRLNEAVVAEKQSSAKLNDSQRRRIDTLLQGEKILQSKSIEDFEHRWSKIEAEIKKISKESDILDKDIENYVLNHMVSGMGGSGLSMSNFLRWLKDVNKIEKPNPVEGVPPVEGYSGVR